MTRSAGFTVVAALAFVSAANAQSQHFTLSGDHVAIYNLAGTLRVEGGSGAEATVDVTPGGADARKLHVDHGTVGGDDALRVIYPKGDVVYPRLGRFSSTTVRVNGDGTFANSGGSWLDRDQVKIHGAGSGTEAYADIHVTVPRGRQVKLAVGAGEISIANVDGQLTASVSTGPVAADHVHGDLTLATGSGTVNVSEIDGNVKLDTGSGSVTLAGVRGDRLTLDTGSGGVTASDIDAHLLTATTGSGTFRLTHVKASTLNLQTGSGSTNVELLAAADNVKIQSGSGSVTLTLPASASAALDVETGSGSIDTDFPVQSSHRQRGQLNGTIGNGQGQIRIETGSGSVRLVKKSP